MDYLTAELMTPKPEAGLLRMKITGESGTESKWLNITDDERRQITDLLRNSRAADGIKTGVVREDDLTPVAFVEHGDLEVNVSQPAGGPILVSIEPMTTGREIVVTVLTEATDEVATLRFNEK